MLIISVATVEAALGAIGKVDERDDDGVIEEMVLAMVVRLSLIRESVKGVAIVLEVEVVASVEELSMGLGCGVMTLAMVEGVAADLELASVKATPEGDALELVPELLELRSIVEPDVISEVVTELGDGTTVVTEVDVTGCKDREGIVMSLVSSTVGEVGAKVIKLIIIELPSEVVDTE